MLNYLASRNKKIIFITYGSKRIKGVQIKAINIAPYLPKQDVIVINHGDDSWLKDANLKVHQQDFNILSSPQHDEKLRKILENAGVLVFCDFPTNMLGELLIFWYAYNHLKTPIIICDNVYNSNQFEQKIYKIFYELSDGILLTGLNLFQQYLESFPKAKLIPPFFDNLSIEEKKSDENLKKKKILYIAYNQQVLDISKQLVTELSSYKNLNHIILSPNSSFDGFTNIQNIGIIDRKLDQNGMRDIIRSADIVVCKFGYQQVIESLALKKPTLAVADSGLEQRWLDPLIRDSFNYYPEYSSALVNEVKELVTSQKAYEDRVSRISLLHDMEFDGGKIAAKKILSFVGKKIQRQSPGKTIALTVNTEKNLKIVKEIFEKELFLLPVIITNQFLERDFGYNKTDRPQITDINNFTFTPEDFLDSSLSLHFLFSPIAYHSLAASFPFIDNYFSAIEQLCKESKKIYIVGSEARSLFSEIIKGVKSHDKFIYL